MLTSCTGLAVSSETSITIATTDAIFGLTTCKLVTLVGLTLQLSSSTDTSWWTLRIHPATPRLKTKSKCSTTLKHFCFYNIYFSNMPSSTITWLYGVKSLLTQSIYLQECRYVHHLKGIHIQKAGYSGLLQEVDLLDTHRFQYMNPHILMKLWALDKLRGRQYRTIHTPDCVHIEVLDKTGKQRRWIWKEAHSMSKYG